MKNSRLLEFMSFAVVAFLTRGQQALADNNHHRLRFNKIVVPRQKLDSRAIRTQSAPTPNLYALQAAFTEDYPIVGANADGTDLWPCVNQYLGSRGCWLQSRLPHPRRSLSPVPAWRGRCRIRCVRLAAAEHARGRQRLWRRRAR
jgi:hypothetical protein